MIWGILPLAMAPFVFYFPSIVLCIAAPASQGRISLVTHSICNLVRFYHLLGYAVCQLMSVQRPDASKHLC